MNSFHHRACGLCLLTCLPQLSCEHAQAVPRDIQLLPGGLPALLPTHTSNPIPFAGACPAEESQAGGGARCGGCLGGRVAGVAHGRNEARGHEEDDCRLGGQEGAAAAAAEGWGSETGGICGVGGDGVSLALWRTILGCACNARELLVKALVLLARELAACVLCYLLLLCAPLVQILLGCWRGSAQPCFCK